MSDQDLERHHEIVRRESRKRAELRGADEISEDVSWVVSQLDLEPGFEVLDVAAGSGLVARALAPHVRRVVASDISPELLAAGAAEAPENVSFEQAAAEDLPFAAGSFDMVATRYSIHHFLHPELALHEMYRVCRRGGELLLIDDVAPDDPMCARRYNRLERSRDSSHIRALCARELTEAVEKVGWKVHQSLAREVERDVPEWLSYYPLDPIRSGWIVRELLREIEGGPETGERPFIDGGRLKMVHTMNVVRARK